MDRMEGVHPRGMLGQEGGVRAIGSAPAAGGSPGADLSVASGGWSRYERLDFGHSSSNVAAVHARVLGAGTLVLMLHNLDGTTAGERLATLTYNVSRLPNDPLRPGWAIARTSNITSAGTKLEGLQTVYVQFWPTKIVVNGPPFALECAEGHCHVEGQICKPGSKGSSAVGYICCGVTGPDMNVACGPRPRRPHVGQPPKYFGAGCENLTMSATSRNVTMVSDMAMDYFVIERDESWTSRVGV
eukprot:SAG31_NODE_6353_length_2048_cov_1.257055_1_plen_243_part_00